MREKDALRRKIWELDFALHELVLFLDTHPTNAKAISLMREYRKLRNETVALYESKFGEYIVTPADAPLEDDWKWIKGPWPWENNFAEE